MIDIYTYTDNAILKQIGQKIKEARLEQNISQRQLAKDSGMSNFSISQIESGHNTSILSLVMVLRALNKLNILDNLFTEAPISPVAISEAMRKQRKRKHAYTIKTDEPIDMAAESDDYNWDNQPK